VIPVAIPLPGLSATRFTRSPAEALIGVLVSAGVVALVTAVIDLLKPHVPLLSLGALYLFAVLPIAVIWGIAFAIPVAIASMLAFNWFYLPPTHTFTLTDSENWLALAVYSTTAIVVSELAARARRRAVIAEQRERESALLATVSGSLLRGGAVTDELERISAQVAEVLGVADAWITLGPDGPLVPGARPHPLRVDDRVVGTLYTAAGRPPDASVESRFHPALASLLAVAIDRDELLREALEAETLRRSDAIKTAVLRAVSHDLRSPLTAIAAAASGLESSTLELDADDRAALLETIGVESKRLDRLVGNLLDLSRLQAGAAKPMRELWSVDELVGLALDELNTDDRIAIDLADDLPPVLTDATQIQRTLVNVLENALRYSPAGSIVRLAGEHIGEEVVLRVTDQGPGIAPAELERIFEPFQRGAAAKGRIGSGLGLAIAHGFAEANGARLSAESDGTATVFALAIPTAPA
jgi:two-component system, OmpR family, sensor histidine kinase KdpD